jgi:hypothetical protein
VLPFPEQKAKVTFSAALSPSPEEQYAPRYPLESSLIFGQVAGGKRALETDQFPVTHHTAALAGLLSWCNRLDQDYMQKAGKAFLNCFSIPEVNREVLPTSYCTNH